MKRADFVGGAIGVVVSGGALLDASGFPRDVVMKIGPSFFPQMLAGLLLVLSLLLMMSSLSHVKPEEKTEAVEPFRLSFDNGIVRAVLTVAGVIVFCLVLQPVGFIITSLVFLVLMMALLGMRRPLLMGISSVLVTAGVYLVFEKLLALTLPAGILEDVLY